MFADQYVSTCQVITKKQNSNTDNMNGKENDFKTYHY